MTRALAGFLFLLLTAPIAAHLLAKASYEAGYRMWSGSVRDDMKKTADSAGYDGALKPAAAPCGRASRRWPGKKRFPRTIPCIAAITSRRD